MCHSVAERPHLHERVSGTRGCKCESLGRWTVVPNFVFQQRSHFYFCFFYSKGKIVEKKVPRCSFTTDPAGKLHVFGHNRDPVGMNGAEIGVLKEAHQVSFRGFLWCQKSSALETKVVLQFSGGFPHQALEGQLANQEISRFLVLANFLYGHGAGAPAVGLFHCS